MITSSEKKDQIKEIVNVIDQLTNLETERILIDDRIDRLKTYKNRIQKCYDTGVSFH